MQVIFMLLQELDRLYASDTLDAYERQWQETTGKIEQLFPGFTLAYAEIYNAGQTREPLGSMRHCLVPAGRGKV